MSPLACHRLATATAVFLLVFASGSSRAEVTPPKKVSAKVLRALQTGLHGIPAARSMARPGRAYVLVELTQEASPSLLAKLEASGGELAWAQGKLAYRSFVPMHVGREALARLSALPEVKRVQLVPSAGPPPLDHSAMLLGLGAARGARPALDLLTGEGVLIGDVDTNADVFHPMFFRADAGYFDWIDVDLNGEFAPGVDAIDLDGDGEASAGETALLLRAETLGGFSSNAVPARSTSFDPAIDWLYLDENGNGKRDYGSAAGADEETPALGEPLFVPDDFDRSGKLDPGERVARLGTSKFRKLYVNIPKTEGVGSYRHVFERDVDLLQHKTDYLGGQAYGYADAYHATSVLSIAAGDVALAGRRWVGLAPDAEILLAWEYENLPVGATTWALGQHPQAMLYEMCPWVGVELDGTDPLSKLIDSSTVNDGVSHVCPVGDQAGAHKHAAAQLAADETATLPFVNPSFLSANYVQLSVYARGEGAAGIAASLVEPDGTPHDLAQAECLLSTGAPCWVASETTERGTYQIDVLLYAEDADLIPAGNWLLQLSAGAHPATVDALLADSASGFGPGVAFHPSIANDFSTIGVPSTADHCIAVAAHTGHLRTPSESWFEDYPPGGAGEVRDYSPWGPRIDGMQKPDVAAPDNPWAAVPNDHPGPWDPDMMPHGGLASFGGTSGAAPHVLGVSALLIQAGLRGDGVRTAMQQGAIHDDVTGDTPNMRYGYGRLSAAGAFGVAPDGQPPSFTLTADPDEGVVGETMRLVPTAQSSFGSTDGLEIKWDDDYDGTWDTPYAPLAAREIAMAEPGSRVFKARVRDSQGFFSEAAIRVSFTPTSKQGGCDCRLGGPTDEALLPLLAACALGLVLLVRRRRRKR